MDLAPRLHHEVAKQAMSIGIAKWEIITSEGALWDSMPRYSDCKQQDVHQLQSGYNGKNEKIAVMQEVGAPVSGNETRPHSKTASVPLLVTSRETTEEIAKNLIPLVSPSGIEPETL